MGKPGDVSTSINHSVRFKINSCIFSAYSVIAEKLSDLRCIFRTVHFTGKDQNKTNRSAMYISPVIAVLLVIKGRTQYTIT